MSVVDEDISAFYFVFLFSSNKVYDIRERVLICYQLNIEIFPLENHLYFFTMFQLVETQGRWIEHPRNLELINKDLVI